MPRSPSSAGDSKVKLMAAVSLLVIALGFIVWYYALRDTTPRLAPVDPEQVRAAQDQQEKATNEALSRGATVSGND